MRCDNSLDLLEKQYKLTTNTAKQNLLMLGLADVLSTKKKRETATIEIHQID